MKNKSQNYQGVNFFKRLSETYKKKDEMLDRKRYEIEKEFSRSMTPKISDKSRQLVGNRVTNIFEKL